MRIGMVSPYSFSRPGGVQGQVRGLAKALRDKGHEVTVFAPSQEFNRHRDRFYQSQIESHDKQETRSGVDPETVLIGSPISIHSNGSLAPVTLSPLVAARTLAFIKRGGFDVVHLHEPMAPVAGYGILASHSLAIVGTYHRSGISPWYRAMRPLLNRVNRRLDVTCAVSEEARLTATAAMGGNYRVLFNGVEVSKFKEAIAMATKGPTVLFLGRHEARKGLEILLKAFSILEAQLGREELVSEESVSEESLQLWIAGDGEETARLKSKFPPSAHIEWLGLLSEEEVAIRLKSADVLCSPALGGESFGMVILEAMAADCVVVASNIAGYRDAAGGHALLVEPGDPRALAASLAKAILDARKGTGLGSPSSRLDMKTYVSEWSMDKLADLYIDIYEEAVHLFEKRTVIS